MAKIKSQGTKPKIAPTAAAKKCHDKPSFSFAYLTKSKAYNFDKLDKNNKSKWQAALTARMIELSQDSWLHWQGLGKEQGLETIPFRQIHFKPNGYTISDDEKIIIFRFYSQNGRILGIKEPGCSILHIIGIDFDFSAYDHG